MTKDQWLTAALMDDVVVAELLLRMKQSSSSQTSHALPPPLLPPIGWGHRKSRSKPSTTTTTVAAGDGFRKEQQSGSPTTPLCWSGGGVGVSVGGGGASTSDGYDESSRPSDLSSGGRSTKGAIGNEGATTSRKRKSFAELKEEEDFLLKERVHLNRELESMRVTMNKQIATSHNLKKFKIDLHQNTEHIQRWCVVEPETERGFVLPDLNMTPIEEEL